MRQQWNSALDYNLHFQKLLGKKSPLVSDVILVCNKEHIYEFVDKSVLSTKLPELTICKCSFNLLKDASAVTSKRMVSSIQDLLTIVFPIFLAFKNGWFYSSNMILLQESTVLSLTTSLRGTASLTTELKTERWLDWIWPVLFTTFCLLHQHVIGLCSIKFPSNEQCLYHYIHLNTSLWN